MRRLALLFAGGALWILISAAPALADGGPHRLTLNNGTSGLAGDCAACHRAHTAQAADLLREEVPGLCLNCHDGTGATADVVDGYQFVPDGSGNPTGSILGALRGGGFSYALLDTGNASRLSYASRGSIILTYDAAPGSGNMTLHWDNFPGKGAITVTFAANASASTIQTALNAQFGTSTTYTSSTSAAYMSGQTVNLFTASTTPSGSNTTYSVVLAPKNEFALIPVIPLPDITANGSGTGAAMSSTIQANVGATSHVGVLTSGGLLGTPAAVTSTHLGAGTVWGNGAMGSNTVGATGVVLSCTNCHNPHGNGQYRILDTLPGEDWKNAAVEASTTLAANVTTGAQTTIDVASASGFPLTDYVIKIGSEQLLVTGGQGTTTWTVTRGYNGTTPGAPAIGTAVAMITADWTAPTNDVEVVDGPALTGSQVHNYTVKPGYLTTNVTGVNTLGDYFRYKFDPSGTVNFTNFYLIQDPMNTGWNGTSPTNAVSVGTASTTLTVGLPNATSGSSATTAVLASLANMPFVSDATQPQPVFIIKIGTELMTASFKVSSGAFVTDSLSITRGYNGSTVAAHAIGDAVDVVSSDPAVGGTNSQLYNNLGRMTAWCIQCHTRYNGWSQGGNTSSLVAQTPTDDVFMFKHGTSRIGCEQCHVNHGTNAVMSAQFSSQYTYKDGTAEDSALLKVNNRGTCNLCHDPTKSVKPGTTVGTVPPNLTTAF